MKKLILSTCMMLAVSASAIAQKVAVSAVPASVKTELIKKYPAAVKVTWEKEDGNFEANWGGKSGEDMSVQFTPGGVFVQQEAAITVAELPAGISSYVKLHYKGAKIKEAGKITNAKGILMYEAEVKGKDLLFDDKGNFVKAG